MSDPPGDRQSAFFILGFSLFVLWESLRLGIGSLHRPGSGFMTFCTALILCGLSLTDLRKNWEEKGHKPSPSRRVIVALVSLLAYSLVLDTLGFVISTFFLLAIVFYLGEPRRWWLIAGMSGLITLFMYLAFSVLLQVPLPQGILGI